MIWRILLVVVLIGGAFYLGSLRSRGESVDAIGAKWAASGHADATAESWAHWNEDEPPEVPQTCAKCHSSPGLLDYLGQDGSTAGVVDAAAPLGTVLYCHACHNAAAASTTAVAFPSGAVVTGNGPEAICMQCHQGTASGSDVDAGTAGLGEDEISADLRFVNSHYRLAAATQLGGVVGAGYQYPDREYVGRFMHSPDVQVCTDCHDPHSTRIDPDVCAPCHANVEDFGDVRNVRASQVDYDGDGNVTEGMAGEVETMQQVLLATIQAYAANVVRQPIAYSASYPYWFADPNGDGAITGDEATPANPFKSFTPRLARAVYNYHLSVEDPGAYTHNARYVLQLLYDSTADLGEQVEPPIAAMIRP